MQGDLTPSSAGEIENHAGITLKETLNSHRTDYMCKCLPPLNHVQVFPISHRFSVCSNGGSGGEGQKGCGSKAFFCPLKSTHLSSGLCTCAWSKLCSSFLFFPQYHDVPNLLQVKHQQISLSSWNCFRAVLCLNSV